jgi:prevent-host-death family protein
MGQDDSEGKDVVRVSSDEARRTLADLLARAGHREEPVVITLYGKDHAALISMKDFERLRALDGAAA